MMQVTRLTGFVLGAILLTTAFVSSSEAQIRPGQRVWRFFGQGYGDGYQKCNPGPNSDYYNPYSAHNTNLISQGGYLEPQHGSAYGQSSVHGPGSDNSHGSAFGHGGQGLMNFQPAPGSAFGHQYQSQSGWQNGFRQPARPSQSVDATFEPLNRETDSQSTPMPSGNGTDLDMNIEPAAVPEGAWLNRQPSNINQTAQPGFAPAGFQSRPVASTPAAVDEEVRLFNPFGEN